MGHCVFFVTYVFPCFLFFFSIFVFIVDEVKNNRPSSDFYFIFSLTEHKQQVSSSAPTRLLPAAHLYHQLEGASVSGFPRMSEDNNSHEKSLILRGSATESLLTSPYHTGNGRPLIFLQTPDVLKRSSYHAAPSAEQKDASGSGNGNSPTGTEDDEKGDEPTFDFTLGACLDRAMDKELNNCRHNAAMARRYDHGRLSMMSNYLALLAQRNKRLEVFFLLILLFNGTIHSTCNGTIHNTFDGTIHSTCNGTFNEEEKTRQSTL